MLNDTPLIRAELTPVDAELFKTFREYQDFFYKIVRRGVKPGDLAIRNGHLEFHFSSGGIAAVFKREKLG